MNTLDVIGYLAVWGGYGGYRKSTGYNGYGGYGLVLRHKVG